MFANLPPEEERHALLDALAALVEERGSGPLVSCPLSFATPECFPDPWTPDLEGVRQLARRLLTYAGLGDLKVELEAFVQQGVVEFSAGVGGIATSRRRHGAAAWFRGISDRTCFFGIEVGQVGNTEQLVGVLAHEVAHAYRAHHGLAVEDHLLEEQLTDLTTVFLGFGVLTTNATDRFRTSSGMQGSSAIHRWERQQAGYLAPASMSFLLAAQVAARDVAGERAKVKAALERNQASSFASALSWLESRDPGVRELLGVKVDALRTVAELPRPMLRIVPDASPSPQSEAKTAVNAGLPVFRIRMSTTSVLAIGIAATVAGALLSLPAGSWWPIVALPGLVVLAKRHLRRAFCTGCEHELSRDASTCTNCGGIVAGEIRRLRDRHEAEVRYWNEHGGQPEWMTKDSDVGSGTSVEQDVAGT